MRIELYQDASLQWRWRGVDGNFKIICDGAEGYVSREAAVRAIDNVMGEFRGHVVVISRNRRRYAKGTLGDSISLSDRRVREGIGAVYADYEELAEYQHEGAKK